MIAPDDMLFPCTELAASAPSRFDDADLERRRMLGDPLGDDALTEITNDPEPGGSTIDALRRAADRTDGASRHLLALAENPPEWVDPAGMEPAHKLALRHVVPGGVAMLAGSLVESYADWRGARVLARPGRLNGDATTRRVFETARFTGDVVMSQGAPVGSATWADAISLRILHARVRRAILRDPTWDTQAWGVPINQEDYALTLTLFSLVYRRSASALGVRMSDAERDANHLTWRWVGFLMGVHPDLLTRDRAEEQELYAAITRRQYAADPVAQELARDLLSAMSARPPFFLPRRALHASAWRTLGPDLASMMELEKPAFWAATVAAAAAPVSLISPVARALPGAAPVLEGTGRRLINASMRAALGTDATSYDDPH